MTGGPCLSVAAARESGWRGLAAAMGQKAELGRLVGRWWTGGAELLGGLERAAAFCCCWAG
jgi:hypothetical protein